MKKIKVTESELISLIEKMVKENMGAIPSLSAQGGGFANLGMAKPTDKYKDLYEDGDLENVDEDNNEEEELDVNLTKQPGSDDEDAWMGRNPSTNMESIVDRLKKKVNETINEEFRNPTKWTQEQIKQTMNLVEDNNEMITEIYNQMVERRDVAPPEGPQG
tara:strand:+ start:1837 stop:2319 length:483 start_codon:yes stop_codon:yes gene_type:complete